MLGQELNLVAVTRRGDVFPARRVNLHQNEQASAESHVGVNAARSFVSPLEALVQFVARPSKSVSA